MNLLFSIRYHFECDTIRRNQLWMTLLIVHTNDLIYFLTLLKFHSMVIEIINNCKLNFWCTEASVFLFFLFSYWIPTILLHLFFIENEKSSKITWNMNLICFHNIQFKCTWWTKRISLNFYFRSKYPITIHLQFLFLFRILNS